MITDKGKLQRILLTDLFELKLINQPVWNDWSQTANYDSLRCDLILSVFIIIYINNIYMSVFVLINANIDTIKHWDISVQYYHYLIRKKEQRKKKKEFINLEETRNRVHIWIRLEGARKQWISTYCDGNQKQLEQRNNPTLIRNILKKMNQNTMMKRWMKCSEK